MALVGACALAALSASGAGAALVETGNTILRADGGFQPRTLPRRSFAPIGFKGHFDIAARSGGRPTPLQQVVVDFDRDGRLDTTGLPTCPVEAVAEASTEAARALCKGAIVGTGQIEAPRSRSADPATPPSAPLTVFNGPPQEGHPTVILHAQVTSPGDPDLRDRRPDRTPPRRLPLPRDRRTCRRSSAATARSPISSSKIGRRYRAGGRQRSYVSARCSDSILETRGRFTFSDGLLIEGAVDKFCRAD